MLSCMTLIKSQTYAQDAQDYIGRLIEIITENLEGDSEFDYNELGELADEWQRKPLDINSPDIEIFLDWNIISEYAYQQLQHHIGRNGPLLSVLELQSIPGFDTETIRILQYICHVQGRETFTQTASLG